MSDAQTGPIFITGRFRSGSTLLWQMFDAVPGFKAFYEPCHDVLPAHIRHTPPMETHRGVKSYWDSYLPLLGELERWHRPEFGLTRLSLEEHHTWSAMEKYLSFLIESTGADRPVLQFNRMDFRLQWLRRVFPTATIIHIHRDVRESYASMVAHLLPEGFGDAARGNMYDLLEWCASLAGGFPFLVGGSENSGYERHYYLWKLSLLAGQRNCDVSISFDEQVQKSPEAGVDALIAIGTLPPDRRAATIDMIHPVEPGRWALIESLDWFERIETRCEETLDALGLNEHFGILPLADIRASHSTAWRQVEMSGGQTVMDQLLVAYSRQRSEVTRLLWEVRSRDGEA